MIGGGGRAGRRGLSTSVSFLIVFVGVFLAMGTLYTAAANTTEELAEAREDQRERHHAVQETEVNVTSATWDTSDSNLTVRVENTGDTTLSVSSADTVVDGTYVGIDDYERVEVDGRDTDTWRPGATLVIEDADALATLGSAPDRVRVVTETGVADATEVVDV